MSIVKDKYDLTEKNGAIFIACLRDSAICEIDGKISLVGKEKLNNYINKFLLEGKFTEAKELIKSAKEVNDPITAEISSKSFRIPFEPYSKLLMISSMNNESLSDSIKRVILPKLYESLDELQKTPDVNINKLNLIKTLLKDWSDRETVVKSPEAHFDVSQYRFEIDNLVTKYLISIIKLQSSKFNLSKSIMNRFFEEYTDLVFVKDIDFCLIPNPEDLLCMLTAVFSDDILDNSTLYYEYIDEETPEVKAFYDFVKYLDNFYYMPLGDYEISFNDEKLFVNQRELNNKDLIKEMIFDKLDKFSSPDPETFEVSDSTLLPRDFEVNTYAQKVQDALLINDYEGALELSEILEAYKIISDLSEKIYDILNRLVKESRVITINISTTLSSLMDLTRGNKSYREFISEAIESCWRTIESQEEIE